MEMVRSTISAFVITFIKTFAWKSLTENQVRGHIYLDKLITGSIYVIKYRFSRNPGNIRFSIILGSLTGLLIRCGMFILLCT